jgi:hypothetical protein
MALKKWNIKTALEIVDLLSNIMVNAESFYINHSALNNYDETDIIISLKIFNAYIYFNTDKLDETKLEEIKKAAISDDGIIINLFSRLIPDEIIKELNKYECGTQEYRSKEHELIFDKDTTVFNNKFTNSFLTDYNEMVQSFLDFCIKTNKNDPEYWLKIFNRLNIIYCPN